MQTRTHACTTRDAVEVNRAVVLEACSTTIPMLPLPLPSHPRPITHTHRRSCQCLTHATSTHGDYLQTHTLNPARRPRLTPAHLTLLVFCFQASLARALSPSLGPAGAYEVPLLEDRGRLMKHPSSSNTRSAGLTSDHNMWRCGGVKWEPCDRPAVCSTSKTITALSIVLENHCPSRPACKLTSHPPCS